MKRAEYEGLDAQILSLAHAGRRKEACALLVDSYGGEILGTCISRVGDAALGEDAAQDARMAEGRAPLRRRPKHARKWEPWQDNAQLPAVHSLHSM